MLIRYLLPLALIAGHCHGNDAPEAKINCPASQLAQEQVPEDEEIAKWDAVSEFAGWWIITGCGTEVVCPDMKPEPGDCRESPTFALVRDRLSLETGCDVKRIAIEAKAQWSRSHERAYRLNACGVSYVCTTAPGRSTECKQAFMPAMPAPQAPPPAPPPAP